MFLKALHIYTNKINPPRQFSGGGGREGVHDKVYWFTAYYRVPLSLFVLLILFFDNHSVK